jgi:DNA/RNA endonuclease YhcR with UshA esterase domain
MKRRLFAAVILSSGLFLISRPALAHHGFAGRYNEENPVTVTGTVVELQFMNPHSSIIFEVKDANGNPVRWQAELASASAMHRADGWTKDTLKPGDRVTITGPQNRNGLGDMNLSHESKIVMTDTGKVIHNSMKAEQGQQPGQQATPPAAY